ncbi:MAG: hypothetical protein ACTHN2_19805 [Nitrobacter sp.]
MTFENNDRLDEARARMTALAANLTKVFAPIDVASLLAGAAFGVIAGVYGRAKAQEYFAELADDISNEREIIQ